MTANTTPRVDVTKALEARQDAHAVARLLADDGFPERSAFIINTLTLLDACIIQLERDLAAIRAETREECARVCDKLWEKNDSFEYHFKSERIKQAQRAGIYRACAEAIRALPDAKGQTKAVPQEEVAGETAKVHSRTKDSEAPAGTAPGREEPFLGDVRRRVADGNDSGHEAILLEAYDALAAELERVRGSRDEWKFKHDVLADVGARRIQEEEQRATTAEASATLHRDACMDYAQKLADAEASVEQMREERLRARKAALKAGFHGGDLADIIHTLAERKLREREGCVSVPREPTEAMTLAARMFLPDPECHIDHERVTQAYKAMLSAAPPAPEREGGK